MQVFWFLPTHGDSRYLGTAEGSRTIDLAYLQQIAGAADQLGYNGVLLPTGKSCEDPWVIASALIGSTRQLKFLVAVRPGLMQPGVAARMASTFDRLSGGRLLVNLVTGGDQAELEADGVFLDHAARYRQSAEFLRLWREIITKSHTGESVDFEGRYLSANGAKLLYPSVQKPYPPIWFGGSSADALDLAAEQVDSYLTWGEPPADVGKKIAEVRAKASALGRKLSFGLRLHVIVRRTEDQAWKAAEELISHVDDATIAKAQAVFGKMDSEGQRRMAALHAGGTRRSRAELEISPNLWAGVGLVRSGAGTALVGDAKTVAARLEEYAALGIDNFILSGYPHLEESYRFAELVFPLLPRKLKPGAQTHQPLEGPLGEIVANIDGPSRLGKPAALSRQAASASAVPSAYTSSSKTH